MGYLLVVNRKIDFVVILSFGVITNKDEEE